MDADRCSVDPDSEGQPRCRQATRWAAAGFLLALASSVVMLLAPLGTQEEATDFAATQSSVQTERVVPTVTHPTLLEIQGWSVAVPLSFPVLLAAGGLIAANRGAGGVLVVAAVLLGGFVVLGALSVGIFYVPAEAAMIVAIGKEHR